MIKLFYFNAFVLFLKFNIFPVLQVRQMLFILQFGHAGEKESLKTTISWRVKSNDLKIFQILRYQCKVRRIFIPSIWFHFHCWYFVFFCLMIIYDCYWLFTVIDEKAFTWTDRVSLASACQLRRTQTGDEPELVFCILVFVFHFYFSMLFFILVFSFYWFVCIIFFINDFNNVIIMASSYTGGGWAGADV